MPEAKTSPPVAAVVPVFPMMAVPAAVPVEVKMASAKGEKRVITAREQTRARLGRPMVMMRSGGSNICRQCVLVLKLLM